MRASFRLAMGSHQVIMTLHVRLNGLNTKTRLIMFIWDINVLSQPLSKIC